MKQKLSPKLSQRQLRVGELVRQTLPKILPKILSDVENAEMVSVIEVRMSPDLKIATCFILPETMATKLQECAKQIRYELGTHLRGLKYLPSFKFLSDETFANAKRIDELLNSKNVQRDINNGRYK